MNDGADVELEERTDRDLLRASDPTDAEARCRRLFDGIPLGLYRTTAEGRLLEANKAQIDMLGFASLEAYRRVDINDLWVDVGQRRYLLDRLARQGFVQNFVTRLRRQDGVIIWVRISVRAVVGRDGEVRFMEGVCEDITDLKRNETARARLEAQLFETLTKQQLEILSLLCNGASDETIARKLDIRLRTVQRRIHELRDMFGVDSRAALAARAARLGAPVRDER